MTPPLHDAGGGLQVWVWVAIGLALAAAEIVVPGATLIWIAGAALAVAFLAWLFPTMGLAAQLTLFAIIAGATVTAALVWRRHTRHPAPVVNLGVDRFVGERATLEGAIVNGRGEARLGDTIWPVRGPELPAGATVRVVGSDGTVLLVEAVEPAPAR